MEILDTFEASFYSLLERKAANTENSSISPWMRLKRRTKRNSKGCSATSTSIPKPHSDEFRTATAVWPASGGLQQAGADLSPNRVDEDIIGNTYMFMISKFAADAGKKAGEFYTPTSVTELVAKLANPKPGQRICGSGLWFGWIAAGGGARSGGEQLRLVRHGSKWSDLALCRMNMISA